MLHNALLDVVMPELNAKCDAAWPILCLIIRQTRGWNRDEQGLSYRQIMAGTGIRSRATVVKALTTLLQYRFPIVKIVAGSFTEASRYSINRDVKIDWNAKPNAMLPVITLAGFSVVGLLGGAVITETVFNYPGIGSASVRAATSLDVVAMLGFAMFIGLILVVAVLVIDILYAFIDPRVRLS